MSVRSVQKRHKWALDFSKYVFRLVIILFISVFEDYVPSLLDDIRCRTMLYTQRSA